MSQVYIIFAFVLFLTVVKEFQAFAVSKPSNVLASEFPLSVGMKAQPWAVTLAVRPLALIPQSLSRVKPFTSTVDFPVAPVAFEYFIAKVIVFSAPAVFAAGVPLPVIAGCAVLIVHDALALAQPFKIFTFVAKTAGLVEI
jgi:hypothetical protein